MSAERPWDRADTQVDERVVRAALAQIPAFDGADIAYLHEGWDSRAFVVGEEWIFRFPKRRPMHERLGVEIALLPRLLPRFHAVCRAIEDIHYGLGDNRSDYVHSGRRVLGFSD